MSGEALPEDVAAMAGEEEKKLNTAAASDQESVPDDLEGVRSGPGSRGQTPNKSNNNCNDGAPPAPSASSDPQAYEQVRTSDPDDDDRPQDKSHSSDSTRKHGSSASDSDQPQALTTSQ